MVWHRHFHKFCMSASTKGSFQTDYTSLHLVWLKVNNFPEKCSQSSHNFFSCLVYVCNVCCANHCLKSPWQLSSTTNSCQHLK